MNVSNEHLLLINILNTMYNDNNRLIQNLADQNNEIIRIITDILHVPSSFNRNNIRNNTINRQQNNRPQNNRNNQSNSGSIFLNNRQYIVDEMQRVDLPINTSIFGTGIEGRTIGNYRDNLVGRAARDAARDSTRDAARDSRIFPSDISGNYVTHNDNEMANIAFTNLFQSFIEPVLVYPTISQIEIATRRALYRDIVAPINSSCPISMENFNDNDTVTIIRHCGHIFNGDELNTWFQSNCRCPVCRYDIRSFNRNTSSRSNQERTNITQDVSGNNL